MWFFFLFLIIHYFLRNSKYRFIWSILVFSKKKNDLFLDLIFKKKMSRPTAYSCLNPSFSFFDFSMISFPKFPTATYGIVFSFLYTSPYGFSLCIFSSMSTSLSTSAVLSLPRTVALSSIWMFWYMFEKFNAVFGAATNPKKIISNETY